MAILQGSFVGIGDPPQLLAAEAIGYDVVRLTFSELMEENTLLFTPGSYLVHKLPELDPLVVVNVVVGGDSSIVDLYLATTFPADSDYEVEVNGLLEDLAGNPMDPMAVSATFWGEEEPPPPTPTPPEPLPPPPGYRLADFEAHLESRWYWLWERELWS